MQEVNLYNDHKEGCPFLSGLSGGVDLAPSEWTALKSFHTKISNESPGQAPVSINLTKGVSSGIEIKLKVSSYKNVFNASAEGEFHEALFELKENILEQFNTWKSKRFS